MIARGDAAKALSKWQEELRKYPPTSEVALEMHQRWLASMLSHAAQDDQSAPSGLKIPFDEARNQLHSYAASVELPEAICYSLRQDKLPDRHTPPPRDILALEDTAAAWAAEEWWDWLNDGFDEVGQDTPTAHLAFHPLKLYPLGNYVQQLGAALAQTNGREVTVRDRVLTAVQSYLQYGDSSEEVLPSRNDKWFWAFLANLNAYDPALSVASGYLDRLHSFGKLRSMDEALCTSISDCVWKAYASPLALAQFFNFFAANVDQPAAQGSYMLAALGALSQNGPLEPGEFEAAAADAMAVLTFSVSWNVSHRSNERIHSIKSYVDSVLRSGLVSLPTIGTRVPVDFNDLVGAAQPLAEKYLGRQAGRRIEEPRSIAESAVADLVDA